MYNLILVSSILNSSFSAEQGRLAARNAYSVLILYYYTYNSLPKNEKLLIRNSITFPELSYNSIARSLNRQFRLSLIPNLSFRLIYLMILIPYCLPTFSTSFIFTLFGRLDYDSFRDNSYLCPA